MSTEKCLTCGRELLLEEVIGPLPERTKSPLDAGSLIRMVLVSCPIHGDSVYDVEPFAPQTSDDLEDQEEDG